MKIAEKARRADKIASLSSTEKDTDGELEKTNQYPRVSSCHGTAEPRPSNHLLAHWPSSNVY